MDSLTIGSFVDKCNLHNIDDVYKRIGRNVARIRKEKGLSQLELALSIGLRSVGMISVAEIYHNKKHFNIEHLIKISQVLEVDICKFFENV
jgi:transcriptional regulator with XRE-family HTH domain